LKQAQVRDIALPFILILLLLGYLLVNWRVF